MIQLHRLGHDGEAFQLNPDVILTIEACPDSVITLATGAKLLVAETPDEIAEEVRAWRVGILADALSRRAPRRVTRVR